MTTQGPPRPGEDPWETRDREFLYRLEHNEGGRFNSRLKHWCHLAKFLEPPHSARAVGWKILHSDSRKAVQGQPGIGGKI